MKFLTILSLFAASFAMAATEQYREPSASTIKGRIHRVMQTGQSLKAFYQALTKEFGGNAVKPLLEIASDATNSDETRWAALFGLARVAGKESLGVITKFMTNSSWMLRDAALKTAAALKATELKGFIEQRLKDDALIVRTTAVQTIAHLNMKESAPKLVDALFAQENFHNNKALWIHKYILQTLADFKYTAAGPKLVELLKTTKDESLQAMLVETLEKLTGKQFPNKSVSEQIYLWKRHYVSEATF